jgi:hypothetical protein
MPELFLIAKELSHEFNVQNVGVIRMIACIQLSYQ